MYEGEACGLDVAKLILKRRDVDVNAEGEWDEIKGSPLCLAAIAVIDYHDEDNNVIEKEEEEEEEAEEGYAARALVRLLVACGAKLAEDEKDKW